MAKDELNLNDDQYNLEDTGADDFESFDDMDGLDFDSPGKHTKTKPAKNISDHLLKSMGSGITSGIKSALKQKFPAISTAAEEIGGLVEDLRGESDDFREKASKELRSIKASTKKLVPHTDKYLPPKLRKKLEDATEGWEAEKKDAEKEPTEEDRRNAEITNSINNLTAAQAEMQKARTEEERHNNQVGQVTDKVRFEQTKTLMTSMDMTLKSIDNFSRRVHLEFLKKGLELKYRHLYVAKDTKTAIDKLQNDMLVQLEKIRHNTGLSDFMRMEAGYKDRVMGRADIRFKKKMGSFLGDFQKGVTDKLFNKALSGLSTTAQMANMGAESAEMMGEMGDMGGEDEDAGLSEGQKSAKNTGGIAAKMGGSVLGKFLSNKMLGKLPTNVENIDDLAKNWQANTMFWADGMRDKLRGKGGLASMVADFIPEVRQEKIKFEAGSADSLTQEAKFDQAFHRSVTEVIPGFLAKILKSTSSLSTGKEQPELAYNFYRNNFTTQEQYRKDIGTKAFGKRERRMDSVEQTVGTTKGLIRDRGRAEQEGILNTQTTGEDIRRMYVKMAVEDVGFRPDQFRRFFEDEKVRNGPYFKHLLPGLEDPDAAVGIIRAAILDENNQIDRTAVSKIRGDLYRFLGEDTYLETLGGVASSGGHRFVQDLIDQEGNLKRSSVVEEYMKGDTFKDETVESAAKKVLANRKKAREERAAVLKQANELLAKAGFNTTVEDLSKEVASKTGKVFHDVYDPMAKYIVEKGEAIAGSGSFKFMKGTIKEQAVEDLSGLAPDIKEMDKDQSRKSSKDLATKLEKEEKEREKRSRILDEEDVIEEGAPIGGGTIAGKMMGDNTNLLKMVKGFRTKSKDQLDRVIDHVGKIREIMESGGFGPAGTAPEPVSGPSGGMGFGGMQQRNEATTGSAAGPQNSLGGAMASAGGTTSGRVEVLRGKGKEVKKRAMGFGQVIQDRAESKAEEVKKWAEEHRPETEEKIQTLVGDAKKQGGRFTSWFKGLGGDKEEGGDWVERMRARYAEGMASIKGKKDDLTEKGKGELDKRGGVKGIKESMQDRLSEGLNAVSSSVTSRVASSTSGIAEDIRNRIDERLKTVEKPDVESKLTNLRNWMSDIASGAEEVSITKLRQIRRQFMETAASGKQNAEAGLKSILSKKDEPDDVSGGASLGSGFDEFAARKHDDDEKMITLLEGIMASVSGMGPKKLQQSGILRRGTGKLLTGLGGAARGLGGYYKGLGMGAMGLGVGGMGLLQGAGVGLKGLLTGTGTAIGATGTAGYKGLRKLFGGGGKKTKAGKRKKFEDVYLSTDGDFSDPLLTAKKQERGEALLWKSGSDTEELKTTMDIDSPVIDKETGDFLITQENLDTGIVTRDGTVISGRGMVDNKKGLFGRAISGISDKAAKKKAKFFDVYEKDKIKPGEPLLSANRQKDGVYFQDGKPVTATWRIDRPVFDRDNNALITQENVDNGLVDIHGKPIKSGGGTGPGFLSHVGKGIGSLMSGAGGMLGGEGAILKMLAGGVGHVSRTVFDKLFNKDKNKEGEVAAKTYEEVTLIRKLLENKLEHAGEYYRMMANKLKKTFGDTDRDGVREGSYQDLLAEDNAASGQLLLPQYAGGTGGTSGKASSIIQGIAGAAGGGGSIIGDLIGFKLGSMGGGFMTKNIKKLANAGKMKGFVKGLPKAGLNAAKGLGGLFAKLPGLIMSSVATVMPMLGSMMSGVILPGLLIAGAGVAGWFAGKWLRKTYDDLKKKSHKWLANLIPGISGPDDDDANDKRRTELGKDAHTQKTPAVGNSEDWKETVDAEGNIVVRDTAGRRVTEHTKNLAKLKKAGASRMVIMEFDAAISLVMRYEVNKNGGKPSVKFRETFFKYATKAAKSKVPDSFVRNPQPDTSFTGKLLGKTIDPKKIQYRTTLKDLDIPSDLYDAWRHVAYNLRNDMYPVVKMAQQLVLRFTETARNLNKAAKKKEQSFGSPVSDPTDPRSQTSSGKKQNVPSSDQTISNRTRKPEKGTEDVTYMPDRIRQYYSSVKARQEEGPDPRPLLEVLHEDLVSMTKEMRGVNTNTGKLNSLSDEISEKTGQQIAVVNNNTAVQSGGEAPAAPDPIIPLIDITNQGGLYAG